MLALLGENGAGKSTLVSQVFGHYTPDAGSIHLFGQALPFGKPRLALQRGVGMVHQHFALADNLTVLENVLVGTEPLWAWRSARAKSLAKLKQLGLDYGLQVEPNQLVSELSVGERQRVEILKALYRGAKILILDEPTAVLTPQESESLFRTLRKLIDQGLSLIFISHKLDEVLRVADTIAVLRQGRLVASIPSSQTSRDELATLMVGREVAKVQRPPKGAQLGLATEVLRLTQIQLDSPRGAGQPFSLSVKAGEILAIAGVSGNGQAALARLLMSRQVLPQSSFHARSELAKAGSLSAVAGLSNTDVARITDDRHGRGIVKDSALWENAILEDLDSPAFTKLGILRQLAAKQHATKIMQEFDVRCDSVDTKTAKLSGGNMQKLILGRNLVRAPKLIIADQPTWGLDVGAVAFIHQRLLDAVACGAAVVLISEDLDEVFALADHVAVMSNYCLGPSKPVQDWTLQTLGLAMAGQAHHSNQAAAA